MLLESIPVKKLWILVLWLFSGSLVYGQEVRTYIPFMFINDLADASFNRTTGLIEIAIKQKQLLAYFDSGLTEPMTVPQYDSLKIRVSIDTFFNGTDTIVNPFNEFATVIYSETIGEADFWEQISWKANHIRVQISSERHFFIARKEFVGLFEVQNTFFIQHEIALKEQGIFTRNSIGPRVNHILSGLAKKTLVDVLSGKHVLSTPYPDNPSILVSLDTQFTPNDIRCSLFSTLALVDCDTLDLDTLSIEIIEPIITGFAISWNYQMESGAFVGRPMKIGLSYHPLVAQNTVELPDNPLFWIDYNGFTSFATEEEIEILLAVLFEFQCWQLSERYDKND